MLDRIKKLALYGLLPFVVIAGAVFAIEYFVYHDALKEQPAYQPELVQGQPFSAAMYLASYQAEQSECADLPIVADVRADDDPSLVLLPRLGVNDYTVAQQLFKFEDLDTYGCQRAQPGQKYWDLWGIEVKCGPAVLQPQVYDENGDQITDTGILMFLYWPGADPFPVAVDPPYATNGAAGFTSGGSIGWAFGPESYLGPDGGPFMVWASSDPPDWPNRRVGSDAFRKVGWFDNHCVPNPMFRVATKQGSAPGNGYELVDYDEQGNEIGHIPFLEGTPVPGARNLGLRLDGVDIGYLEWINR